MYPGIRYCMFSGFRHCQNARSKRWCKPKHCLYFASMCLIVLAFIYTGLASKAFTSLRVENERNIQERFGIGIDSSLPIRLYPKDGVGTRVDISKDFNVTVFNTFCDGNTDLVAIIPVYSAADNFKRRHAIRDTVGKNCATFKCAVFFIVGVSNHESVNESLKTEHRIQKDILIINKIDTYRDLNNKAMAMLDWLVKYCPRPKYVIHTIDDTYPNIRYFIDHMDSINETKYILGETYLKNRVIRWPANKWFTSISEYPIDKYPTYTVGTAYAFLNSNSKPLRDAAFKALYVWVEDVWLTGFVRIEAGFDIVHVKKTMLQVTSTKDPNIWSTYFCVHKVNVKGYYDIYNATLDKM